MCYYENNKKKFKSDCIELNDAIGNAITDVEERHSKRRSQAITEEITPVVLAHSFFTAFARVFSSRFIRNIALPFLFHWIWHS